MVITVLFSFLSVVTFILFGFDKRRAMAHKWRISERTLLCFSFFGGIGGLLAMLLFHHKTRKWRFRILVPLFAFVDASVLVFLLWSSVYYAADISVESAMLSDDTVTVEKTEPGWLFDGPSDKTALIFYPGAKVDETAYAPMLRKIAEEDMDVYIVKMPLHLAFLGINKAEEIIDHSAYGQYYMAGHSLGGAMAADYAAEHESDIDGIILFGAYPTKETNLDTLLIYGSEDRVLNRKRVEDAPSLVKGRLEEIVIDGGNHAQFGNYGEQRGDGKASISGQNQQAQTVEAVREFIKG